MAANGRFSMAKPKNKKIRKVLIDNRCFMGPCLGKGYYDLPCSCLNCHWEGTVRQTKGHKGCRWECPNCGCDTVEAR